VLSWQLIEWKVAYYLPDRVHPSRRKDYTVSDEHYDACEQRYLTLCRKLYPIDGTLNTIVHKSYPGFSDVAGDGMMEVDESRPSVKIVLAKLGSPKRKRPGAISSELPAPAVTRPRKRVVTDTFCIFA
jgi:hypothetical protein